MLEVLIAFVVFGGIGLLIGQKKGRLMAGLLWSMLLGPIGWLIVALGPDLNAEKAASCPHCRGVLPMMQKECNHCKNGVTWVKGKPRKRSISVS